MIGIVEPSVPLHLRDASRARPGRAAEVCEEVERELFRGQPFAVILHNDPINGFDFVVRAIQTVFGYGPGRALWLTLKAHLGGQSELWRGPKSEAEGKAERMVAMGPDPVMRSRGARALRVSVEPVGEGAGGTGRAGS